MKSFTDSGIPALFVLLAIAAEFLGSLGLAVGLLTRIAAFGIACVMLVAIVTVHWPHGFFMNWHGNQKGEGFEYQFACAGHCDHLDYYWCRCLVTGRALVRPR